MSDIGNTEGAREVAEAAGNESGEWSTIQRELLEDAPDVASEATGILKALIARVRMRKALRSYGIERPARIAAA